MDAVLAELEEVRQSRSALGLAALNLARQLDHCTAEPGWSLALLNMELRVTLAAALYGATHNASSLVGAEADQRRPA